MRADRPDARIQPFIDALLAMSFQDPKVRVLMELEGLKQWLSARTTGYAQLEKRCNRFNFYGSAASTAGN